jgi:hypothetical protein
MAIAMSRALAAATGTSITYTGALHATPASDTASATATDAPSDRWLLGLQAKRRQFFGAPAPAGGIPLVHVMNYYDTYNKAYGVKDADIGTVPTFYGATTLYAVNDAAWVRYRIGEFLETVDPATGKPATSNP